LKQLVSEDMTLMYLLAVAIDPVVVGRNPPAPLRGFNHVLPLLNPPATPAATGQPPARALETPAVAGVRMTAATAGTSRSHFT
jgi:hypothetical protein